MSTPPKFTVIPGHPLFAPSDEPSEIAGVTCESPPPPPLVYLAGPMTGRPEFNFPAFEAAAEQLRDRGLRVFSPAERDRGDGFDPRQLTGNEVLADLRFDLRSAMSQNLDSILYDVDAVVVMDGWLDSRGSIAEVALANSIGKPVVALPDVLLADSWVQACECPIQALTDLIRAGRSRERALVDATDHLYTVAALTTPGLAEVDDEEIDRAIAWLTEHRSDNGLNGDVE